jgi:hypothetical protein
MNPSWRISEEIEKPFRDALDHAAKRRVSELHGMLARLTDEQIAGAIGLSSFVTAYVAINAVSRRWPTDHGLHVLAQKTVEGGTSFAEFGATEQNVYLFTSKCALGFEPYGEAFNGVFDDPHEFLSAPFFITVSVLATFVSKGQTIWEFLNLIETAYEAAWLADLNLLPALMVRSRMPQPEPSPDAGTGGR